MNEFVGHINNLHFHLQLTFTFTFVKSSCPHDFATPGAGAVAVARLEHHYPTEGGMGLIYF